MRVNLKDVLSRHSNDYKLTRSDGALISVKDATEAMQEYAKHMAIGFAEWIGGDDNPFLVHEGRWIQACGNSTSWTTVQLFEMFIKGTYINAPNIELL